MLILQLLDIVAVDIKNKDLGATIAHFLFVNAFPSQIGGVYLIAAKYHPFVIVIYPVEFFFPCGAVDVADQIALPGAERH